MSKVFTASDVAAHNKPDDLYIIVDGDVYDITKFQDDHPGMSFCLSLPSPFFLSHVLSHASQVHANAC